MNKQPNDSPAIQLLRLVWDHVQESSPPSWLKWNHAMRCALELAIKSGMRFGMTDFGIIADCFWPGYWWGDSEWIYATAVLYRNNSAWKAYESYRGRQPFIVAGARLRNFMNGDGPSGHGLTRLVVGAEFKRDGEDLEVASFNDSDATLTACSYTERDKNYQRTIKRRYKLTPQTVKGTKK